METKKIKKETIGKILNTMSGSRAIGPKLETSIKVRDIPKPPGGAGQLERGVGKKSEQLRKMLKKYPKPSRRGGGIKTTLV